MLSTYQFQTNQKIHNLTTTEVGQMSTIPLYGNVTPTVWYQLVVKPYRNKWQPYRQAIDVLSDIVGWYQPVQEQCEKTNQIIFKNKFKGDYLSRTAVEFADQYGGEERAYKTAVSWLKNMGFITRKKEACKSEGGKFNGIKNFIIPFAPAIREITYLQPNISVEFLRKKILEFQLLADAEKCTYRNNAPSWMADQSKMLKSVLTVTSGLNNANVEKCTYGHKIDLQGVVSFQNEENPKNAEKCTYRENPVNTSILHNTIGKTNSITRKNKINTLASINRNSEKQKNETNQAAKSQKQEKRKKVAPKKEKRDLEAVEVNLDDSKTKNAEVEAKTPKYQHPEGFTLWFWSEFWNGWWKATYDEKFVAPAGGGRMKEYTGMLRHFMSKLTLSYREHHKSNPSLEVCQDRVKRFFYNLPDVVLKNYKGEWRKYSLRDYNNYFRDKHYDHKPIIELVNDRIMGVKALANPTVKRMGDGFVFVHKSTGWFTKDLVLQPEDYLTLQNEILPRLKTQFKAVREEETKAIEVFYNHLKQAVEWADVYLRSKFTVEQLLKHWDAINSQIKQKNGKPNVSVSSSMPTVQDKQAEEALAQERRVRQMLKDIEDIKHCRLTGVEDFVEVSLKKRLSISDIFATQSKSPQYASHLDAVRRFIAANKGRWSSFERVGSTGTGGSFGNIRQLVQMAQDKTESQLDDRTTRAQTGRKSRTDELLDRLAMYVSEYQTNPIKAKLKYCTTAMTQLQRKQLNTAQKQRFEEITYPLQSLTA